MYIIVGLGNPGPKYQNTRHNLGQNLVTGYIQQKFSGQFQASPKTDSEIFISPNHHLFAYPTTYMNESGQAVQKLLNYYKISPENLCVIHDDLDLRVGEWKNQFDRGAAGHNGVNSIIEHLGTQAFHRLRLGIDHPADSTPVENYVLQPFSAEEKAIIQQTIGKIYLELDRLIGSSTL
jgi:PTH1 family peptidyl-tRNA hydrolase